jgi:hypothetical protein
MISHTVQELHMMTKMLISQDDGLHQEMRYVLITLSGGASIMECVSFQIHASALTVGRDQIAVFLFASMALVCIMEIAPIPIFARKQRFG